MEKIDLRTAMAQLRAAVQRDATATDNDLLPLNVNLYGVDGGLEYKAATADISFSILEAYTTNPNKYLPKS